MTGLRQVGEEGLPRGHAHAAQERDDDGHQQGLGERAAVDEAHDGQRSDDQGGYEEEPPPPAVGYPGQRKPHQRRGDGLHCRDEPPLGEGELDDVLRGVDDPVGLPDGGA